MLFSQTFPPSAFDDEPGEQFPPGAVQTLAEPEPELTPARQPEPEAQPVFVPPLNAFGNLPVGLSGNHLLSQTPMARTSQPDKERQLLKVFITAPEEQADLLLQLPERWLDDAVCQRIYSACHELAATGRTVNMHSVADQIRTQFPLPDQEVLLHGYEQLLNERIVDTTENLLIEVRKAYQCRVMYKDVLQNLNREFLRNAPIEELYDKATRLLLGAEQETSRRPPLQRVIDSCYEKIMNPPKESEGLTTGLRAWDETFGGIVRDRMYVFAGLTGAGKTAALIDFTVRLLKRHIDEVAVLIISLEMSEEDLTNRIYSREAGISPDRMRDHMKPGYTPLNASERARLYDAHQTLKSWPAALEIHYGTVDAMMIRQLGRRFCLKHHGKHCVIAIDHLGMVEHSGKGGDNIRSEFINAMKAIKSLNMDFGATTIPLVQMRKDLKSEKNADGFYRPHTGYIAESGFIEQTADAVLLWWRPEAYCTELGRTTMHYGNNPNWDMRGRTIGIVGKNRYGQSGIDLMFDSKVQFSELQDSSRMDYL